jgi:ribosomal-protein-alanine N-acetyltransferase
VQKLSLPLPTPRLAFRRWRLDNINHAAALWADRRVTQLIGGPFDDNEIKQRLSDEIARQDEHGFQYWPIFLRETNVHVGCCGLRPYDAQRGILELGFHLRHDHWGQGYATEAARAAIEFAFNVLGVRALFAGHNPNNESSRRTLEKLGFEYARDELYAPTGKKHPSYLLTRERYLAMTGD